MLDKIKLSDQQWKCITAIERWLDDPNGGPSFTVHCFVGTGKREIIAYLANSRSHVHVLASTAVAADVLGQMGLKSVCAYNPTEYKKGYIVVVDEGCMLRPKAGSELLARHERLLVFADPAQLPPFMATGYFMAKPDFTLTEIEAADDPIMKASIDIREGRGYDGDYGDAIRVVNWQEICGDLSLLQSFHQIICQTNKRRRDINCLFVERLGLGVYPNGDPREKLACLSVNSLDRFAKLQSIKVIECRDKDNDDYECLGTLDAGDGPFFARVYKGHFEDLKTWDPNRRERSSAKLYQGLVELSYAFALTAHNAQGSEWPNVLVLDEGFKKGRETWLYTAVTLASERVTICRMKGDD